MRRQLIISALALLIVAAVTAFLWTNNDDYRRDKAIDMLGHAQGKADYQRAAELLQPVLPSGDPEIEMLYLFATQTKYGWVQEDAEYLRQISILELRKKGQPMAQFLAADPAWESSHPEFKPGLEPDYFLMTAFTRNGERTVALEQAAENDYLPAQILLAYVYYNQSTTDGYQKAVAILKAASERLMNNPPDALQQRFAKGVLQNTTFGKQFALHKVPFPLLSMYRVKLLTQLTPEWTSDDWQLTDDKNPKTKLVKELMGTLLGIWSYIPADADREESLRIADELLAEAQLAQLEPQYHQSLMKRRDKILARQEVKNTERQELEQRAASDNPKALATLFLNIHKDPAQNQRARDILETLMRQAEVGQSDEIFKLPIRIPIADTAFTNNILRRCATLGNAKCMSTLAASLLRDGSANGYAEGFVWVYRAIAAGDMDAEKFFSRSKRNLRDWIDIFIAKNYQKDIPTFIACRAAKRLEKTAKEVDGNAAHISAYADRLTAEQKMQYELAIRRQQRKITPEALLILYQRGAENGTIDCIERVAQHYYDIGKINESCSWAQQLPDARRNQPMWQSCH